jgi:HEAT repeat protein
MDSLVARQRIERPLAMLGMCLVLLCSGCGPSVSSLEQEDDAQGLIAILANPHRSLSKREQAAQALGRLGDPAAVDALVQAMQEFVQHEIALVQSDEYESKSGKDDSLNDAACAVAEALAKIGDRRAVDPLSKMLQEYNQVEGGYGYSRSSTPETVVYYLAALVGRGDAAAVDPLIEAFLAQPGVRKNAAEALGKIGDGRAVESLSGFLDTAAGARNLKDREVETFEVVVAALGKIGDERAVDALVAFLDAAYAASGSRDLGGSEREICEVVIDTLGAVDDTRAVKPLLQLLGRQPMLDRKTEAAILAFGKRAIPLLLDVLSGEDLGLGQEAACMLAGLVDRDTPEAADSLIEAFRRGVHGYGCTLTALGRIDENTAVGFAMAFLEESPDETDKERSISVICAIEALGRIGEMRAEPVLISQLATAPESTAANALAELYDRDTSKLLPLLKSRRTYAVYYALVGIGDPNTIDALVEALERYDDRGMAAYFLNCGCYELERAAADWAKRHGYKIVTANYYGSGGNSPWGSMP